MVIRSVGPLSVAKVAGLLYAVMGLIFGAIIALAATAGAFANGGGEAGFLGAFFGIGAVVFLPLLYGCMGFVITLIAAWLYNLVAGVVGGVHIEVA